MSFRESRPTGVIGTIALVCTMRNRFKSAVARDGKNMRDVLLEFMEEYVNQAEQPKITASQNPNNT